MSGNKEKVITETVKDGKKEVVVKTITKMSTSWNNISQTNRHIIIGYTIAGCVYVIYESYKEGRDELIKYRTGRIITSHSSEWEAVKYGCSRGLICNVIGATFWPFSIGSSFMPNLVLLLNPVDKK